MEKKTLIDEFKEKQDKKRDIKGIKKTTQKLKEPNKDKKIFESDIVENEPYLETETSIPMEDIDENYFDDMFDDYQNEQIFQNDKINKEYLDLINNNYKSAKDIIKVYNYCVDILELLQSYTILSQSPQKMAKFIALMVSSIDKYSQMFAQKIIEKFNLSKEILNLVSSEFKPFISKFIINYFKEHKNLENIEKYLTSILNVSVNKDVYFFIRVFYEKDDKERDIEHQDYKKIFAYRLEFEGFCELFEIFLKYNLSDNLFYTLTGKFDKFIREYVGKIKEEPAYKDLDPTSSLFFIGNNYKNVFKLLNVICDKNLSLYKLQNLSLNENNIETFGEEILKQLKNKIGILNDLIKVELTPKPIIKNKPNNSSFNPQSRHRMSSNRRLPSRNLRSRFPIDEDDEDDNF